MTKKTINTGRSANDQTGDSLRSAFTKINENFAELYSASIPSQIGNTGKYLTTDGANLSWQNIVIAVGAAPTSPVVGQLWYDTNSGRLFVFYDHNWVDTN